MAATTRTPLRYPGGKQRLAPFIYEIISANHLVGCHYVEPYCGGAGAALELLFQGKVSSIHLNDSSRAIYAFWYSVLNRTEDLCKRIISASLTVAEWRRQQQIVRFPSRHNLLDLGFATFYLNRVNRSGILSAGLIGGLNQDGNYKMDARFTRSTLVRKIQNIAHYRQKITLSNLDAELFLDKCKGQFSESTLIYFDPPYYIQGGDLYLNSYSHDNHLKLSYVIQDLKNVKWILSYDAATPILKAYSDRRQFTYDLQYHAADRYKGKEVFIFSDEIDLPRSSSLSYIDCHLISFV
jgi:DNA adenine methylase